MDKYKLIAICGKSASGKDTLLNNIVERNSHKVQKQISHTSRPMRDGEKDGVDYYFVNEEYFKENSNEFLEILIFNNWYYGASTKSLSKDKINIGIFTPEGLNILMKDNRLDLFVLFLETDDRLRMIRYLQRDRKASVKEAIRRYNADEEDFKIVEELKERLKDNYLILSDNGEDHVLDFNTETVEMIL